MCMCMYVYVPVWLGFPYSGLLWKVEVRLQCGFLHMLMRSKVMHQGLGSSEVKLSGKCWFSLFWSPLKTWKSGWNQTWVKDTMEVALYVNEVKGHVPRSRVIWGQVRCKMHNWYNFFEKFEVHLQPNLICRCNMWISYLVSGWGIVKLSFVTYFLCELLWY